ncbi:MAG: glycosyl hydrolase [Planctomycetota bacterium]
MNLYSSSKPYTRWWWFSNQIKQADIRFQLDWLKRNNFGGVEIAWVYPLPNQSKGPKWLSKEWSQLISFTKRYADKIGLGYDFTFGSLWPFGGSIVKKRDASRTFKGLSEQRLYHSWESAYSSKPGYILNHLAKSALSNYARIMGRALAEALKGSASALFCDSWEVNTKQLWTRGFGKTFRKRFGYALEPFMDRIDKYHHIRYDYRKLLAEYILNEFYRPFTKTCHRLKAQARVQCHGSPTDLLASYAAADIPESEAILFDPDFSVIPASAAALAGLKTVSAEAFTCLYGWKPRPGPAPYGRQELTADLKLLVDALFANGVNQIFWHGMPYNPKGGTNQFYASVHIGPDGSLAAELPAFNRYMQKVSAIMKRGATYSDVAAYLPIEDTWMLDRLPKKMEKPSAFFHWEMHYIRPPAELKGYHPLWVSAYFLKDAQYDNGILLCGKTRFSSLYIDVNWMDSDALIQILRLARQGLPVCLKRRPKEPGRIKTPAYNKMVSELTALKNVSSRFSKAAVNPPLVKGVGLPDFWCRVSGNDYYIFFAHPLAQDLSYPLSYGQSFTTKIIKSDIAIKTSRGYKKVRLVFKPYQSVMLKVGRNGSITQMDISFMPRGVLDKCPK